MALLIPILTLAIRSCLHGRLIETCSTNHQTVIISPNKSLHAFVLTSQVIMGICELSRSFWMMWDISTMDCNGLKAMMNEYNIVVLVNVSSDYYYDDDDDDDDDYNGNNLNSIQLSVSICKEEDQEVQRLDDIPSVETAQSDFGRSAYEQEIYEQKLKLEEDNQKQNLNNNLLQPNRGELGVHIHPLSTADILEWSPPKMTLEKWNVVDVWQGILYLGDEWDALNYLEIIEYFINCASGYCAFEYGKKSKYYWFENWRQPQLDDNNNI